MIDVDDLVAQLDARGERWDMYRGMMTGADGTHVWIVHLGVHTDPQYRTVRGDTIGEALAAAVASPPLPVIPQRPLAPSAWEVTKRDGKWVLATAGGMYTAGRYSTKKAAEAARVLTVERETKASADWADKWSEFVRTNVENVDFRWATR